MSANTTEAAKGGESRTNDLLCVVCGNKTNVIFNIKFKAVHICESCANTITAQHITDLVSRRD